MSSIQTLSHNLITELKYASNTSSIITSDINKFQTFFLMKHSAHRVKLWWKSSQIFGRISPPSSGDSNQWSLVSHDPSGPYDTNGHIHSQSFKHIYNTCIYCTDFENKLNSRICMICCKRQSGSSKYMWFHLINVWPGNCMIRTLRKKNFNFFWF